jgi:hypothetical protein
MDPVNPWLDPAEVRHLAEQLLRPVAPAHPSAVDPGFDASFIGFTKIGAALPVPQTIASCAVPQQVRHTSSVSQLSQALRPAEQPALPVSQNTLPASEPPPATPSLPQFLQRIHIFRDWLAKNFQATDIFLLNREGKVIFDESGHGQLHFMARTLASATRATGNVHIKIGPAAILELIPCETPYGRIVLGALVPDAPPAEHIKMITEVLLQVASPT